MRTIRTLAIAAILPLPAIPPAPAGAQAARWWTSFATGLGLAQASMRGDTIYSQSGQIFARIGFARRLTSKYGLEVDVLGGRPFGAGDCIPGVSVCAPAFNFVGASANVVTGMTGVIAPNRVLFGAGVGLFRVAPTESHAVSPRPAPALQASAEIPLIGSRHGAFTFGLRGLVWPAVHGQSLAAGLVTAGLRIW